MSFLTKAVVEDVPLFFQHRKTQNVHHILTFKLQQNDAQGCQRSTPNLSSHIAARGNPPVGTLSIIWPWLASSSFEIETMYTLTKTLKNKKLKKKIGPARRYLKRSALMNVVHSYGRQIFGRLQKNWLPLIQMEFWHDIWICCSLQHLVSKELCLFSFGSSYINARTFW